ncbi:MAG: Fic family protein [Nanoarchaeota archaeon]
MSHLELKRLNGSKYIYFVKKVSFMSQKLIIKKHIGVDSITINKEKYILDKIDEISNEEFNFRKKFLSTVKDKISYNAHLPEKLEIDSIKIENLIEGKKCREIIDNEFAKEFIFNSNNMEGSKIPADRVREIIDTGDTKYKDKNEVKEVQNSILAFDYLKKSFKFNLSSIKRVYNILTKDLVRDGNQKYPKGFKKEPNIVGNSETTPPEKVEEELNALINWYKKNKNNVHPLLLAFEFHRRYEFIHPFLDGNGRTGRLIMNKILISNNYQPIIIYKDNKMAYFNAIEKSKEKSKLKSYYHFMLEQTSKSYTFLLKTIQNY